MKNFITNNQCIIIYCLQKLSFGCPGPLPRNSTFDDSAPMSIDNSTHQRQPNPRSLTTGGKRGVEYFLLSRNGYAGTVIPHINQGIGLARIQEIR